MTEHEKARRTLTGRVTFGCNVLLGVAIAYFCIFYRNETVRDISVSSNHIATV